MNITYPNIIVWRRSLSDIGDPYQAFSPRLASDIRRSFQKLTQSAYHFKVEPVDQSYLNRFIPLYETFIKAKPHGHIYDVQGTVKNTEKKSFEAISLYEQGNYRGGFLYAITTETISTYYKVFPRTISVNLRASISFLAEYLLCQRALQLRRFNIIHGQDMNVFGQHSNIGLAMFKIQAGNRPYVPRKLAVDFLHEFRFSGPDDVLIFQGNKPGKAITKAVLFLASPVDYQLKYHVLLKQSIFELEIVNS